MATIGEVIGGAKFRSIKNSEGYWSDPLIEHDFYSVTRMPTGTKFIEGQSVSEMITKIKADETITFKKADLSEETKKELDKENIIYDAVKEINK